MRFLRYEGTKKNDLQNQTQNKTMANLYILGMVLKYIDMTETTFFCQQNYKVFAKKAV